jgi:hypothetical protein
MDRFPVTLGRERLVVDRSHYICGFAPPDADCVPPAP